MIPVEKLKFENGEYFPRKKLRRKKFLLGIIVDGAGDSATKIYFQIDKFLGANFDLENRFFERSNNFAFKFLFLF